MSLSSAYLLISHGSRDPRQQLALEKLAELVRVQLETQGITWIPTSSDRMNTQSRKVAHKSLLLPSADAALSFGVNQGFQLPNAAQTAQPAVVISSTWFPLVGTATLELAALPLHERIRQFAHQALSIGCNQLQLLPLFLLSGVHVMEDIPTEVSLAQNSLGQTVVINQRPHLGVYPGLARLLANQSVTVDADAKIVLAHGTRRPGGNDSVETVAEELGAVAAYWSVQPTLEERVKVLADSGHKQIAILPYFLFAGGITDAIAQKVTELQKQFPAVQLSLGEPIGATAKLAQLILDLIEYEPQR